MISKLLSITLILMMSLFLSSCEYGGSSMFGQNIFGQNNSAKSGWNFDIGGTGAVIRVAAQVESAADRLFSRSLSQYQPITKFNDADRRSCHSDKTGVITIYSVNGKAQHEIEVALNGSPVGNLTTYFPDTGPACRTPSRDGVITLRMPAGEHILEASSLNYIWPGYEISIEPCECTLLPLS